MSFLWMVGGRGFLSREREAGGNGLPLVDPIALLNYGTRPGRGSSPVFKTDPCFSLVPREPFHEGFIKDRSKR